MLAVQLQHSHLYICTTHPYIISIFIHSKQQTLALSPRAVQHILAGLKLGCQVPHVVQYNQCSTVNSNVEWATHQYFSCRASTPDAHVYTDNEERLTPKAQLWSGLIVAREKGCCQHRAELRVHCKYIVWEQHSSGYYQIISTWFSRDLPCIMRAARQSLLVCGCFVHHASWYRYGASSRNMQSLLHAEACCCC